MTQLTTQLERTARRLAIPTVPLLAAATGTAAAHGGGSYGSETMGGGSGLFGGTMGLWGPLWMGLLVAVPLSLVLALGRRREDEDEGDERPLSVLRGRYARGELSDDEFDRRRAQLERVR